MDFWLAVMFEDNSQLLDIARAAEEMGYAGIAVADHVAVPHGFTSVHPSGENPFDHRTNFPDPLTTIAAMAAVTTRLRFMPYVYILPMREPFSVAKQAGTVAMLSDYRFVLGVGAGWLAGGGSGAADWVAASIHSVAASFTCAQPIRMELARRSRRA